MTPFFITGLPRSRTAWLANLFTGPDSLCLHDGLRGCDDLDDLTMKMSLIARAGRRVGNSDSGLLHCWRPLVAKFPNTRWLVTVRDPYDAAISFYRWFSDHPYQNMNMAELNLPEIISHFEGLARKRDAMIDSLGEAAHVIQMDDWDVTEKAKAAWDHILPTQFDVDRYLLLAGLRINPMSENISLNVSQVTRLLESVK